MGNISYGSCGLEVITSAAENPGKKTPEIKRKAKTDRFIDVPSIANAGDQPI